MPISNSNHWFVRAARHKTEDDQRLLCRWFAGSKVGGKETRSNAEFLHQIDAMARTEDGANL